MDQKGRFVPVHDSAHAVKESTTQSTTENSYLGVDAARDDAFGSMASASGRMPPTSREFYYNSERAQTDMEQAILSGDQMAYDEAFARHTLWEQTYDDRQITMQGHRAMPDVLDQSANFVKQKAEDLYDFATEHPFQATWEAGEMAPIVGGFMTGGRVAKEVIQGEQTLTGAAVETGLAFGGAITKCTKAIGKATIGAVKNGVKTSSLGKRTALKATKVGGVIHADAIPAGLTGQKIGKSSIDTTVPKKVHGNSREYVGENHVYVIREVETGRLHKVGESMQGTNKLGQSRRAEQQRRKLEKETGKRYETEIREIFPSKGASKDWETKFIKKLRKYSNELPGNKGNH